MFPLLLACIVLPIAFAGERSYELAGRVETDRKASVSLFGSTTPFAAATLTDSGGRFRFRKLPAGTYTLVVFVPGRGESRRTVEVGAGTAGKDGRVNVTLALRDSDFAPDDQARGAKVSARELAIPDRARREYEEAQKKLTRSNVDSAVAHLTRAVELAPQFAAAWNTLGTIAYQTHQLPKAEGCFRQALLADPGSYEATVNLGGALVTERKASEALAWNQHAVLLRPNDALANSQLGLTWYELGRLELGEKYLERARQIDPAHFSHPQLVLADIHLRQRAPAKAADDLQDFLAHHPDYPGAAKMRDTIAELRRRRTDLPSPHRAVP